MSDFFQTTGSAPLFGELPALSPPAASCPFWLSMRILLSHAFSRCSGETRPLWNSGTAPFATLLTTSTRAVVKNVYHVENKYRSLVWTSILTNTIGGVINVWHHLPVTSQTPLPNTAKQRNKTHHSPQNAEPSSFWTTPVGQVMCCFLQTVSS